MPLMQSLRSSQRPLQGFAAEPNAPQVEGPAWHPLYPQLPAHELRLALYLLPAPGGSKKHSLLARDYSWHLLLKSQEKQEPQTSPQQTAYWNNYFSRRSPFHVL